MIKNHSSSNSSKSNTSLKRRGGANSTFSNANRPFGSNDDQLDKIRFANDELVHKLTNKISDQARELISLSNQLEANERKIKDLTDTNEVLTCRQHNTGSTVGGSQSSNTNGSRSNTVLLTFNKNEKEDRSYNIRQSAMVQSLERRLLSLDVKVKEITNDKLKLSSDLEKKNHVCKDLQKQIDQMTNSYEKMNQFLTSLRTSISVLPTMVGVGADDSTTGNTTTASMGVDGKGQFSSSTYKIQVDKILHTLKSQIDKNKHELMLTKEEVEQYKRKEGDLHTKINELSDMLQIKLDEYSISSYGDLLAVISKQKGEIVSMKADVQSRQVQVADMEGMKSELVTQRDNVHSKLLAVQQQLNKANNEVEKLSSSDIGLYVTKIEQERDTLLDYIHGDMEKSNDISEKYTKLHQLHDELTRSYNTFNESHQLCESKQSTLQQSLEIEVNKTSALTADVSRLKARLKEGGRQYDILKEEKRRLMSSHDTKTQEYEELSKMQIALLTQVKAKDDKYSAYPDQIVKLTAVVDELSKESHACYHENQTLKSKLKSLESECTTMSQSLHVLQPKMHQIEPELSKLKEEKSDLQTQLNRLQSEVLCLRPLKQQLDDLNNDLVVYTTSSSSSSSSRDTSPDGKSSGDDRNIIYHSQTHTSWTSLPALRHLSSQLYEMIRTLASDYSRKEMEVKEVDMKYHSLRKQISINDICYNDEIVALTSTIDLLNHSLGDNKLKLSSAEEEVTKLKACRSIIDQLKMVLLSHTGGVTLGSNSSSNGTGMSASPITFESILNAQSPVHAFYSPYSKSSQPFPSTSVSSAVTTDVTDYRSIPDYQLPDIVGKALMHNASAVSSLQETISQHRLVNEEIEIIRADNTGIKRENDNLRMTIIDLQRMITTHKSESNDIESKLRAELSNATELVEKQNSLVVTLENKLDNVKNEKQLKSSQMIAMQQREESIRQRLCMILRDHIEKSTILSDKMSLPSDALKVTELIQVVNDALMRLISHHSFISDPIDNIGEWPNDSFDTFHMMGGLGSDTGATSPTKRSSSRPSSNSRQATMHSSHHTNHPNNNSSHYNNSGNNYNNSGSHYNNSSSNNHNVDKFSPSRTAPASSIASRGLPRSSNNSGLSSKGSRSALLSPATRIRSSLKEARQSISSMRE